MVISVIFRIQSMVFGIYPRSMAGIFLVICCKNKVLFLSHFIKNLKKKLNLAELQKFEVLTTIAIVKRAAGCKRDLESYQKKESNFFFYFSALDGLFAPKNRNI